MWGNSSKYSSSGKEAEGARERHPLPRPASCVEIRQYQLLVNDLCLESIIESG
jgi:hypothetical protein